jgi:hypothetical protein
LPTPTAHLSALGWATVDLERAVSELAGELGVATGLFAEAPGSVTLGARCLVAPAVLPEGRSLVLLEPATEGRLATTLARLDEGPSVAWYTVEVDRAGMSRGAARAGPFGPERLVPGDPDHGPHRFLLERPAGTIAS